MIDANELRLGNLVLWNAKLLNQNVTLPPLNVEVTAILTDKIGYASPGMEYRVEPFEDDLQQLQIPYKSLEEFEPIVLTPEILSGAGFTYDKSSKTSGWFTKILAGTELKIHSDSETYSYEYGTKKELNIKNVHQLQNLYYALTGSNLDVQLSS